MDRFITYVLLRLKNYLKLTISYLNSPHEEEALYHTLARAIVKNKRLFKKIIKSIHYSNFFTVIVSFFVSIIHSTESPFLRSSKSRANAGIVVVNEPATDCIFVLYFNFMPPNFVFLYIFLHLH